MERLLRRISMPEARRSISSILLEASLILVVSLVIQQNHFVQAASLHAGSMQQISPRSVLQSGPFGSPFVFRPSMYSAAQRAILKQARTTPKTIPKRIGVAGASLSAANATYTLANGFDVNGFRYFQNGDATQYCQWSTISLCWCIRSSLIADAIAAKPTAEYVSNGKQTYSSGPAGTYNLGGMGYTQGKIKPPTVKVIAVGKRSEMHH